MLAEQFDAHYDADPEQAETRLQALRLCLARLSAEDRELVETRYSSARNGIRDYAAKIGKPFGTVRVNLHRIRHGLRRCITERLRLNALGHGLS
jgi:DNA-directed RNA polymerase specialized sigma24 family protein